MSDRVISLDEAGDLLRDVGVADVIWPHAWLEFALKDGRVLALDPGGYDYSPVWEVRDA